MTLSPSKNKFLNFSRTFEEYLEHCHGNEKLAKIRYEYKEAER